VKTIRLGFGLALALALMVMLMAVMLQPIIPYLVVLFFLASIFYFVIKGR
jgi:hypothetical protein